jgi:uncharacterized protein
MEQRMSVITLGVSDLARARRFYEQGLGWQVGLEQEQIVFFQLNGLMLALYPRELLAEDAQIAGRGEGFTGITLAQTVRTKEAVDALLAEAQCAGGKLVKPAQTVFWGGYSGYFSDPDGHLWEIAYDPECYFDEQGNVYLEPPR